MPRPLPAHLASAMLLWLSSRAGLMSLPNALLRSNAPASVTRNASGKAAPDRLLALAGEIQALGSDRVAAALDRELGRRAAAFVAGLEAYPLRAEVRFPDDVGEPLVDAACRAEDGEVWGLALGLLDIAEVDGDEGCIAGD